MDLVQNKLIELAGLWELVSRPNKRKFYDLYGQIASLITIEVDEPLIKASIQFWDPLHKCFTFNEEDMIPTAKEYSMYQVEPVMPRQSILPKNEAKGSQKAHQNYGIEPVEM